MNTFEYNELLTIPEYLDFDLCIPDNECCICICPIKTFKDGVKLPCCRNFVHPCCLINTFIRVESSCCPLCRCKINDIIYTMNIIDAILFRSIVKLLIDSENIEKIYQKNKCSNYATEKKSGVLRVINILSKFYNNIEEGLNLNFLSNKTFMTNIN